MKRNTSYYDKTEYVKDNIEPLVRQIKILCSSENIPMFISIATANDKTGTKYDNDVVLAMTGRHLTDNRIGKMLLAINDFDTDIPDRIKREAQDLQEYLDEVKEKKATKAKVRLKENKIDTLHRIGNGGDKIEVPKPKSVPPTDFDDDEDMGEIETPPDISEDEFES